MFTLMDLQFNYSGYLKILCEVMQEYKKATKELGEKIKEIYSKMYN